MTLVAATAAAVALIFAGCMRAVDPTLGFGRHPAEIAVFVGLTTAAAVSMFNDNLFIALRRSGFVLSRNTLVVVLRLTLPFVLLQGNAFGIFASYWLAAAVALVLYLVVLARSFALPPRLRVSAARLRAMWRYSAGNYLATVVLMMPMLLMPMLVAHRAGAVQAAYYYIASLIAAVQVFVPQATARSFFAEVTDDPGGLRRLLLRTLGLTAALQLPLLLALVGLGRPLLGLFGAEYQPAYPLLVLLTLTQALSSVGFIGSTLLLLSGRLRLLVQLSVGGCAVSLAGAYLLADRGLVWVGWSLLAGEAILAAGYLHIITAAMRAGIGAVGTPDPTDRPRLA
jgi:O-antigen/teichoic acid export membrane protein